MLFYCLFCVGMIKQWKVASIAVLHVRWKRYSFEEPILLGD